MNFLYKPITDFSVIIVSDRVKTIESNGEIILSMPNRTRYKIRIENSTVMVTDAEVFINDAKIGVWRINPLSTLLIDRPMNVNKKFNFVKDVDKFEIIKVIFNPEEQTISKWLSPYPCNIKNVFLNTYTDRKTCLMENNNYNVHNFIDYPQNIIKMSNHNNSLLHNKNTDHSMRSVNANPNLSNYKKEITIKIVINSEYVKPFISSNEYYKRKITGIEILNNEYKKIPKIRQYEDYHLLSRVMPYE